MDEMDIVRKVTHLFYLFRKENMFHNGEHPGMKHREIMMLDAIMKLNDKDLVKMSDLSAYFQITPAAVSQLIKNFEKKNWIERIVLDNDRRSVYIKVSDEAKQMMQSCEKHMTDSLLEFIEALGEDDAQAFVRILEAGIEFSKRHKDTQHEKGDQV